MVRLSLTWPSLSLATHMKSSTGPSSLCSQPSLSSVSITFPTAFSDTFFFTPIYKPGNMTPASTTKAHKCLVCNQPPERCCSTSRNARYCSTICEKKDLKMHKMVCNPFAPLVPRPGSAFFRGILFTPNEPLPRFVWAEYSSATDCTTMKCRPSPVNTFSAK